VPTERENTNNSKYLMMAIFKLHVHSMQLQKDVKSLIQNRPVVKKCAALKKTIARKSKIQSGSQEMAVVEG